MSKNLCNIRFVFSLTLALLLLALPAEAADLRLRPFKAQYDLFESGMHIAVSELRLERSGDSWRFRTSSKARGIFAWFTRKKPFSETTFTVEDSQVRLQQIVIGDASKDRNKEAARFDWDKRRLEVMRKGKRRELDLNGGVYDYQSIHLLAASMGNKQLEHSTVDFYRKGKLQKARFVYSGEQNVNVNGKGIGARVYEQVTTRSKSKIKYYYDADNPLLPLRIEKIESGESPTVMVLRKVDWKL